MASRKRKAFDRLDEAAPANLKTEWLASERIAQSNRINDPAAMDVYEININVVCITLRIHVSLSTEQKGD
jgi:hypothetical protein